MIAFFVIFWCYSPCVDCDVMFCNKYYLISAKQDTKVLQAALSTNKIYCSLLVILSQPYTDQSFGKGAMTIDVERNSMKT